MNSCQLVAVLGAGGVGKTTTSAAIALGLADQGMRVALITVDPAKRLAQALGLETLSNDPKRVFESTNQGLVDALWIDPESALRDLVFRQTRSTADAEFILNNRLFKILQTQLGGIEDYLGVEKILFLKNSNKYDVCVLDTPPSRHALDFLESPGHLLRFFDESVLRFFMAQSESEKTDQGFSGFGFIKKALGFGKSQALEIFKNFLGNSFLLELGTLLAALKPVHAFFTQTARDIESWVTSSNSHFVIVSTPETYPADEGRLISHEISVRGFGKPKVYIFNKCFPPDPPPLENRRFKKLGTEFAENLRKAYQNQVRVLENFRNSTHEAESPLIYLPRFSVRQLTRNQLMYLGREILKTWSLKLQ